MSVISESTIGDHLDFIVMQPDYERAVVRDLVFAVMAFNKHSPGKPLQISFPLFTDTKVSSTGALGPCVRITGPSEKLYTITLRTEIAAHLRAGRAMTLIRDRVVVEAGRNERFALVPSIKRVPEKRIELATVRPLVLSGHSRLIETAGQLGVVIKDEAAFVERQETPEAKEGKIDLLGFSDENTVPVLK
jgi:hypothetical protein